MGKELSYRGGTFTWGVHLWLATFHRLAGDSSTETALCLAADSWAMLVGSSSGGKHWSSIMVWLHTLWRILRAVLLPPERCSAAAFYSISLHRLAHRFTWGGACFLLGSVCFCAVGCDLISTWSRRITSQPQAILSVSSHRMYANCVVLCV